MRCYLLMCSLPIWPQKETEAEHFLRVTAFHRLAFNEPAAWSGTLNGAFFSSDRKMDELMATFATSLHIDDFALLVEIGTGRAVYAGPLVDEEGFRAVFPIAQEFGGAPG